MNTCVFILFITHVLANVLIIVTLLGDGSSFLDGIARSGSTFVLVSSTSQEKRMQRYGSWMQMSK